MWNCKLCLGLGSGFDIPISEQIKLLKQTGFDGFFTEFSSREAVSENRQLADEYGLIYQSLHAPFGKMKTMWEAGKGDAAVAELIDCLETCAENRIPIMVAHTFIGFEDHTPNEIGLENFGKVVLAAERLGVKIAFENTEGEEYLEAVMKRFNDSPAVGFCLDTGHEMCYNHSKDLTLTYGDKLIATHINDNLGIKSFDGKITFLDDLHLLPFDGIRDWQETVGRLARCGVRDLLTFELNIHSKPGRHDNDIYEQMPLERYFALAFARACRVARLLQSVISSNETRSNI